MYIIDKEKAAQLILKEQYGRNRLCRASRAEMVIAVVGDDAASRRFGLVPMRIGRAQPGTFLSNAARSHSHECENCTRLRRLRIKFADCPMQASKPLHFGAPAKRYNNVFFFKKKRPPPPQTPPPFIVLRGVRVKPGGPGKRFY